MHLTMLRRGDLLCSPTQGSRYSWWSLRRSCSLKEGRRREARIRNHQRSCTKELMCQTRRSTSPPERSTGRTTVIRLNKPITKCKSHLLLSHLLGSTTPNHSATLRYNPRPLASSILIHRKSTLQTVLRRAQFNEIISCRIINYLQVKMEWIMDPRLLMRRNYWRRKKIINLLEFQPPGVIREDLRVITKNHPKDIWGKWRKLDFQHQMWEMERSQKETKPPLSQPINQ